MEEIKMQASDGAEMRWTIGIYQYIPLLRMKQITACLGLLRECDGVYGIKVQLQCTQTRDNHPTESCTAHLEIKRAEDTWEKDVIYTLSLEHLGEWKYMRFTQEEFDANIREASMLRALGD